MVRWQKNGSFTFAEALALSVGAKANVPLRDAKEFQNFLCGGKKIKTRSVWLSRSPNTLRS